METFEIKGFWGILGFLCLATAVLGLLFCLPASCLWILWNAFIGELMGGPMIDFPQSLLLTAIVLVALKIIVQPEINVEIKRMDSPPKD